MIGTQPHEFWTAVAFGAVFFIFLVVAFFAAKNLTSGQHLILHVMTSIFGAITGGLFIGAAKIDYHGKVPGGEFTVSGVAGFVVFILAWLVFPKRDSKDLPPGFNFHVPAGWSFRDTLDAIASQVGCTVDYGSLTAYELNAKLRDHEVHSASADAAIRKLRQITEDPSAVRRYNVSLKDSTYYIEIQA